MVVQGGHRGSSFSSSVVDTFRSQPMGHGELSDSRRAWSFAMPRAGWSFLRNVAAASRSSSGGEMVESEVVDI